MLFTLFISNYISGVILTTFVSRPQKLETLWVSPQLLFCFTVQVHPISLRDKCFFLFLCPSTEQGEWEHRLLSGECGWVECRSVDKTGSCNGNFFWLLIALPFRPSGSFFKKTLKAVSVTLRNRRRRINFGFFVYHFLMSGRKEFINILGTKMWRCAFEWMSGGKVKYLWLCNFFKPTRWDFF